MRAIGHGCDIQRYKGVVGDDDRLGVALHVANDGRRWRKKGLDGCWPKRKNKEGRKKIVLGLRLLVA